MASPYEESILTSLRRISRAIDLHSRRLAKTSGLTVPQLICLRHLARNGPSAPTVVAREIALSSATVTGIFDRLVRRGLVTRRRLEKDRRRVEVGLTPEGATLLAGAPSPLQGRFAARLTLLPDPEQERIDAMLKRVVSMMEAEALDAAPLLASGPPLAGSDAVMDFLDPDQ